MERFLADFGEYIEKNDIGVYRISVMNSAGEQLTKELVACNPCQNSYSVAKVFTLTALGLLYDEGRLDLQSSVAEAMGDDCPDGMDPQWERTTVDMLIRHHSGLPQAFLDIDVDSVYDYGSDFLACVLRYPVQPPDRWVYSDADYYLLARIAEKCCVDSRCGKTLMEYLWEKLFFKLRFQEAAWSCCPMGHIMGATGLYIRTEDMVKLGALYLNGGVYGGERILSEKWVDMVRQREYLPSMGGGAAYGHAGMMGQMLLILPGADRAVAWHGYNQEKLHKWVIDYFR